MAARKDPKRRVTFLPNAIKAGLVVQDAKATGSGKESAEQKAKRIAKRKAKIARQRREKERFGHPTTRSTENSPPLARHVPSTRDNQPVSTTEWISIVERLPEPGVEVLIFIENSVRIAEFVEDDQDWGLASAGDFEPTYWMPLPSPPNVRGR